MLTVEEIRTNLADNPLVIRAVFNQIGLGTTPEPGRQLTQTECLRFWTALMLRRLERFSPDAQVLLADHLLPQLTHIPDAKTRVVLVIADSRFATWYNHTGWLDLHTGNGCTELPAPALETVAFDLAVLFQRNFAKCQAERKKHATRARDSAG